MSSVTPGGTAGVSEGQLGRGPTEGGDASPLVSTPEVTAEVLGLLWGCEHRGAALRERPRELKWFGAESRRLREAPAVPWGGSGVGGAGSWWTQPAGISLNGGENEHFKTKDTQP